MSSAHQDVLRLIPSVDALVQQATTQPWAAGVPRLLLTETVREVIQIERAHLSTSCTETEARDRQTLAGRLLGETQRLLRQRAGPYYRRAINATGIILHTGLGRAVLPKAAVDRIGQELSGYSVLQVDVETGKRSRRDTRIEWLLQRLTGAEAATVVNNNAAATMLVLNTVARGREVIVSRGQLVEIGGSFRLPDVMALSGAKLVEVGTTNKTHPRDYERAINDNTAAILRVHPSNYRIEGFTAEVPLDTLVQIAHDRGLPLIDDVGAGALMDYRRFGLPAEPTLPDSIRAGADLVLSSADKMIGGAQGGIIIGQARLVEVIRKNPLARALRVDKITLSVLETTLMLFLDPELALREVPTLGMMQRPVADVGEQAERIAAALRARAGADRIAVIDGFSQMGSGSLPGHDLPTRLVAIEPADGDPDGLAARLRAGTPPVFARIAHG
ncbi:MAG: L-seryl-tRNA(Sec) selenium transferase, partial [Planctomycetes bacterium]|nr:L-seryl-tRNA(Sec) selenium transferase [Planctomycetota bacterium]